MFPKEQLVPQQPLTKRQILIAIEGLYDLVLSIEQLRRDQPSPDDENVIVEWYDSQRRTGFRCLKTVPPRTQEYHDLADKLWLDSKIMAPLETRCERSLTKSRPLFSRPLL